MKKLISKFKTKNLKPKTRLMFTDFRLKNRKLLIGGVSIAIVLLAFGLLAYQQIHKNVQKAETIIALQAYVSKVALPGKDKNVKRVVQKEAGYTFTTAEKGNIDSPVSFAAKGGEISFTSIQNQNLGGLNPSDMEQTKNGKTIYNNIYNGIDLIYTPSANGILEEYRVKVKRPLTNIIQKINITGLTYKTQTDGSMLFYNKDNQFAFAIPKPVMYEEYNTKNRNYGLHYEIFAYGGNTYLAKVIDNGGQEWLSKTNYPVMIDATILLTLFSYQSYPTIASNWQVSIDTVGTGDLKIQPAQGTTWQDLSLVSIACGGNAVQYSNSGGVITIPNYSCSQNTIVTTKVADSSKQYSLTFGWSGYQTVVQNQVYTGKPVIISSSLNPAVVKIGDTITVKTEVADQNGVKSVKADMGGIKTIDLALSSGTPQDGVWQGQWKVEGTGTKPYETIITASNDAQTTSSSIGFFDPYTCLGGGDHAGAAWDPATDCPSGFAGNHTNIGTLSVGAGETATVQAFDGISSYGIATISATTVTIASTGTITAAGKGWAGAPSGFSPGSGPGGGSAGQYPGGGGYGGLGATGAGGNAGGGIYGSLSVPGDLGSGGGSGNNGGIGGAGGGAIRINATGTLTVSGTISANGQNSPKDQGGGGSGGSIYISAGTLAGAGAITANGGNSTTGSAGGGGGGRIAVYYTSANNYTGTATVTHSSTYDGASAGTDGTAFIENSSTGDITIPSNNGTWNGSDLTSWTFHNITINGNITFKPSNATLLTLTSTGAATIASGITVSVLGSNTTNTNGVGVYFNLTGNVTLPATSVISGNAGGYLGGSSLSAGSGPGGGGGTQYPGGGGYGGLGAAGTGGAAGTIYGSLTAPTDLGSGGGAGNNGGIGGAGGGAIKITTTGTLTISGTISANGQNAPKDQGGGGSGGSIYLSAATVAGAGTITANGGNSTTGAAGGGGGGRIVLGYSSSITYSGAPTTAVGTGGTGSSTGTYLALDTVNNDIHIRANQSWKPNVQIVGTSITVHGVYIENNATLTIPGYYTNGTNGVGLTFNVTNFNVASGATISTQGYAAATGTGYSGGAGGYGGTGGGGGAIYGSLTAPVDLGSGGTPGSATGGPGGGAIKVIASSTVTVSGTISSNGTAGGGGCFTGGSGGSGGSIYITSGTFTGNGAISANGGNGGSGCGSQGSNGGGGRIAVYYSMANNYTGTTSVTAGTYGSGAAGTNGTAFIENSTTHDLLIPANNGIWNGSERASWNLASLTVNGNVTFKSSSANLLTITVGGATTIASGVTITASGSNTTNTNGAGVYFNLTGNVTIPATSSITADAQGYAVGAGPGTGNGASYGGAGGGGAATYGSSTMPVDLGSGGTNNNAVGGAGGGAIRLSTNGTLTVSGSITANGGAGGGGCYTGGSGGSGGSLLLTAGTLAGVGTISANGGNGGSGCGANGGNGGGGRIAVYYNTANSWGGNALTAAGATAAGTGGGGGANGTVNVASDNVPSLSNISQYQTDCTNSVAVGGTLQGNNQGSTGCFKATVNSGNSSDSFIYQLEAQPIGTSFTNFYTASSSATAFSGTAVTINLSQAGFTLGVGYHWQYKVIDSKGSSTAWASFGGNAESVADFVANVPAPANITGTYNSDSQITVTWTNTALNVVNFEIQRSTNGGAYATIGTTVDGNTLTFVDNATNNPGSPPAANHKYQYQVRSTFGGYNSDYGTASSLVYTTPAAPSGVTISQTAVGSITVNWTNNANYPANFTLQRKIGSGSYTTVSSTISPTATSYVDTNVQQAQAYDYQIEATRTTPNVLSSAYAQDSGSVNNTKGFGKGIYLTQNGTLVVQNNFKNSVDVFNNIQNDVSDKVGQAVAYDSTTPASGPNLPTGSTVNGLTVKEGVSGVDGKSNVIYVATNNGLVAIHENSTAPALGGVKYYTNNYVTEMMYGDIRGMWPLDASASSGLIDASNKNQTLTNNGAITFTAGGIRGTAATLNGTTQYLSIADNANLSVTGNLSFGAWFKTTSTSSAQTIMAKNGSYSLGLTSSGILTASIIGATTGTVTGSTILDTGWHQADVVYNSSAQSITLYLDGKVEGTTTTSVPPSITDSAGDFEIGGNSGAVLFSGNIDEPFVTAAAINAGEVASMNLNGQRSLQNHPGNIIAGVATNNYQRLLGNGAGDSTVNNVQIVAVDDGNQFIYAGTNDLSGNTGGTTAIGVHSDSVSDLYSATNTLQKDDQGNAFSANDVQALSVSGIPNPGFNTNSDYSQNGGTVAIAGANDTASRLYIRNQSYSLTQVLAQGGAVGGSKNSFNVGNLFTVGNLLGNSASTSGEVLQIPAFQVDQNGIVIQNYLGTDTTQTVATFNGGALTSGTIFNISGPNLTSGTGLNLTSSSTNFTGSLANFSLSATGSGTTGNVMSLTNYSSGGGNALNVQSLGTGSTNIALYASASGATNNYAALFPSGYVGIGTTSPTSALDIVGNASTSGQLTLRGSSSSINGLNGYGLTFKVSPGGDAGLTTAMFINSAGNLGLGTVSPTATLDVNGSASIAGQLTFENGFGTLQTTNNQLLTFGGNTTGDIQFKPGNSSTSLYLTSSGNVGIGTTGPLSKLDVNGGMAIGSYAGANTAPSNGLIVSGNVGIGTNNPGARLEVKGTSQSVLMGDWGGGTSYAALSLNGSLATGNYNFLSGTGDTNLYINRPTGKDIRFRENNTDQVIIQATTGNLGIGTTGPATALEVSRGASDLAKLTSTTGGTGNKAYLDFQTYNGSGVNARIGAVDYGTYNGGLVFEVNPGYGSNSTRTTEAVRINQNGQVGIGIPTPVGLLNVSGTSSGQALFNLNYLGTDQNIMTASVSGVTKFALDTNGGFTSSAGAQWKPFTNSTTALQIANSAGSSLMNFDTTNQRVGIGTTSATQTLDINGAMNLLSSSTGRGDIYAGTNLDQIWSTSAAFNTAGATFSAGMTNPSLNNQLALKTSIDVGNGSDGALNVQSGQNKFAVDTGSSLTASISSYWKFDENSGSSVGDSVGTNTGTWHGTLGSQWATGILSSAGSFNGSNNYVSTPNVASNTVSGTGDFALSFWIYRNSNGTGVDPVTTRVGSSGFGGFVLSFNASASQLQAYVSASGSSWDLVSGGFNAPISNQTWTNVVFMRSGSTLSMYVNGVANGTTYNIGTNPINNPASGIYFGSDGDGTRAFAGKIDEAGVWSRALTQQEITDLYNSGNADSYSSTYNINTQNNTGRTCADGGDAVMYRSTASTATGSAAIVLSQSPSAGCLSANDEVLVSDMQVNSGIFNYTGSDQTFTVPAGVTSITVKSWGGGGGGGNTGDTGGGGGYVTSTISVTPGEVLTVIVGGGGQNRGASAGPGTSPYGGGGLPGSLGYGGQGGGRSAIRRSATELITAAGGGGGGYDTSGINGGAGGGLTGVDGYSGTAGYAGKGGTQSAGGAGGGAAQAGSAFQGGNSTDGDNGGGGGGGGGYYGGGAGSNQNGSLDGSGGGGSSYYTGVGSTLSGSGTTPGNSTDPSRGIAGVGGAAGSNGNPGEVIISYGWGSAADVGNYEIATVSSVLGSTVNLTTPLANGYDGISHKIVVQRVPQYTNVTVGSGANLTASAWNGTTGGVLAFKANGTLNIAGSVLSDGLGYRGGTGGAGTTGTGGTSGESYDGTVGSGGAYNTQGTYGGGTGDQLTTTGVTGVRGGGGGGGADSAGQADDGAGGGAGGGYAGGGGGGGAGVDVSAGNNAGGTGGTTGVSAGGGGNYSGGISTGGNAGSAGSGTYGGAAGSGSTTGQGAGGAGSSSSGAGGAGGGGLYGVSNLSKMFLGSGGGGGGGSTQQTGTAGSGGAGGGVVLIYGSTVTVSGSITSNGYSGSVANSHFGAGGGGSGGSVKIVSSNLALGSSLVTAAGGAASASDAIAGGGGAGGVGRIAVNATSTTGTTNPTFATGVSPNFMSGDQTWYSNTVDMGAGNTALPNYLTVNYTLDGTDNIAPKFEIQGSNTGSFAGEQTVYPAGNGSWYQNGGTYSINNGTATDITGTVNQRFRYWRVVTDLNTGSNLSDSPVVSSIRLQDFKQTISLLSSGNVGIGAISPSFKLDVQDNQTATSTASFTNLSTSATADVLSLKVATTSSQLTNKFVTFLDGNGNILGKIQGNGSGGVTYATNGVDFAEYYKKDNVSDNLNQGDVVCLSQNGGAGECSASSSGTILGVISDRAGFIGGGSHEGDNAYALVGIIGQLPVRVSTQSGVINPSDPLTVLPDGGVGKQTTAGTVLGHALEKYDPQNPKDKIQVSINVSWYDPNPLANNNQQTGTSSGILSDLSSRIDILSGNISTLQNFFTFNSTASAFLNSATSATGAGTLLPSDQLDIANATISGKLMVLGRTTLSDLGVTGKINSGLLTINGFDDSVNSGQVTINTLAGDLYLQNKGLGGVNILNGLVTIDTSGNMNLKGVLGAGTVNTQKLNITSNQIIGSGVIKLGQTQVTITTTVIDSKSKIFITPTTPTGGQEIFVTKNSGIGFTANIENVYSQDIKFDWWIVGAQ